MKKEENKKHNNAAEKTQGNTFQLVSKILIILLAVAIIVQICVIISIKIKHDNLKDANEKLPTITSISQTNTETLQFGNIEIDYIFK